MTVFPESLRCGKLIRGALLLILTLFAGVACKSSGAIGEPSRYVKPAVAVQSFENRAPFPHRWQLGDGMSELLLAALVRSERLNVVSRAALDAVFEELDLQGDVRFRDQGRVAQGQLKNAQYLIRGTVVDFTHTSGGGLHFMRGLVRGRVSGYIALVTIAISVIDIESREVFTETFSARAWAAEASLDTYQDMAFGGQAFHRTPLGKATAEAIRDAMYWVVDRVASDEWTPLIAKVDSATVYISGGSNRGIVAGEELEVRLPGEAIVDPATGDLLGYTAEQVVGRLRVVEVQDAFAVAEVLSGTGFEIGQSCRRLGTAESD